MKPHFLALYCLIGDAVSAWSNPPVTIGADGRQLQTRHTHRHPALFASSLDGVDTADAAAGTNDVSIEYNAAAKLAYDVWRKQYPPPLKASQRVLLSAEEVAAGGGIDPAKFATFERNYEIVTVANIRAKRAARMYGGEAEIVTLGSDADTVALPLPPTDADTVALPLPPSFVPDTGTSVDAADVSIQYNAPARLAYDEWLAANGRAGEEFDDVKFGTFEQNYVAVSVANTSAKKAARDAGESADTALSLMELGSDADSVISSGSGAGSTSWGIVGGLAGAKDTKLGSLSFGEEFGESFKWKSSSDDRLRSALGIDASSSSDSSDTGRSATFFFTETEKEKEAPHLPEELPSYQDVKARASDKYEVVSEGDKDLESKTVAELRDMLERKGMPVSGTKSELIYRLQNADDAESEVVKETKKNMEREYGVSISVDKVREILAPIFSGKVEANVSTDAIKGAALAGAALPIIAGAKGAGLSLAALSALSSSYLAVTQGYGGDAARAVGELAWKSTGAFKSVGTATKFFVNGAVNIAKEKSREQMLEAVTIGDTDAAGKLDKDVQQILEEAEEAVAAAERAVETSPDNLDDEMAAKAEELAKLEDEDLLAKEFERARMEEVRAETFAQAQQERIKEDQLRAEEDAARLAEEDRLEEEASRLLAEEEAMLLAEQEADRLQDATEDADIAEQARAAVEAMKQMEGGLPDFDEDDESVLGDEDLEAAIALAQEFEDDKIAGVDGLLQALRELDADGDIEGDDDEDYPELGEDDATFSDPQAGQEQAQNPEDLARAAREAVEEYEAEMAAKSHERKAQKSEWAEAVAAVSEDREIDASPTATATAATDWASLTVAKLKDELRSRGLKVGGKKAELIERLQEDDMSR